MSRSAAKTANVFIGALICAVTTFTSSWAFALNMDFDRWLVVQEQTSRERLLRNISPEGAARGAVVASPSRVSPPYFFHWVRDAAVTMEAVLDMYVNSTKKTERQQYREMLIDFVRFSRENQLTQTRGGLGEPKYNADGSAYNGDWGRPQNDGPSLRAAMLTRLAWVLIKEGDEDFVRRELYSPSIPAQSVIKADLEYVSHRWFERSFDLWEEVEGFHFYTLMVHRKALIDGAKLAEYFGDGAAAHWYSSQAKAVEQELDKYWSDRDNMFVATLMRTGGLSYKSSNIDAANIIAVLHGYTEKPYVKASDVRMLSTFAKQVEVFGNLYQINRRSGIPGTAIGRYPEDLFAGNDFNGGNPWVLLTSGFAHYCYKAATELAAEGKIKEARVMVDQGDDFLKRVQYHTGADGALWEQMNRDHGYMMAARDLTWSYVETLEAIWKREIAVKAVKAKASKKN